MPAMEDNFSLFPDSPRGHHTTTAGSRPLLSAASMETQSAPPFTIPGPTIANVATALHLIEAANLPCHPLKPAIHHLINRAFSAAHPPWLPASMTRLRQLDTMERDLGPNSFTYALTAPIASLLPSDSARQASSTSEPSPPRALDARVVASVSARAYAPKDPAQMDDIARRFLPPQDPRRQLPDGAHEAAWEMKFLVTDPDLFGHGLASALAKVVEHEMRRRWELEEDASATRAAEARGLALPSRHGPARGERKLRVFLQTIKQMNEAWYRRRGYSVVHEGEFEKGFIGSEVGFTLVGMVKDI